MSGWLQRLAFAARPGAERRRACILLWMAGGPSQMDTFDLKPGHANGGPFRQIPTAVPGIRIGEHLPQIARRMEHLAIIRSMSTREGEHQRATFLLRTGHQAQGPVAYPPLGALVAKELGRNNAELPNFVSIGPLLDLAPAAFGPGFLGAEYAPL